MKYANRFGDLRSTFYRKGDNIELARRSGEGYAVKYYKIVDVLDSPGIDVYLGSIDAGSRSDPTEGSKVELSVLQPQTDGILTHALIGVDVDSAGRSCQIRVWRPKENPIWLSPDGNYQGYVDAKISPVEDPNELFPLFVLMGDVPYARADNPHSVAIEQWIVIQSKRYIIEELKEKPSAYAPIPYQEKVGQR